VYKRQGLAHAWNFNHGAAIEAFRAAQAADPDCAMCWWGESFVYGPNINAPMPDEAVAPAYAALRRAQKATGVSEKEKALIAALAKRYQPKPSKDRTALDAAFADAMDAVARAYPDDDFIASLTAEAIMDAQPWDYWEADGRTPKGRTARAMSLIETVLARNPKHQAAIHLYIHLTEATQNPYKALRFADSLAALSPGLGHLLHMPSHTYYRIGRFRQSLEINHRAVAADEAFLAANKAHPMYEFGYYVHNVHFVMTSAQMAGDAATALEMAKKLDAKLPLEMAAEVPFAQPIKAAPYYAFAQFGEPDFVLALPDPGTDLPFVQAAWRYARGEALARAGNAHAARAEAAELARIVSEEDLSPLEELNIPASDIIRISRLTVTARAAAAEGDYAAAVAAMEEAVTVQDALTYTEPPYWYYPARQTLAAMALRNGDAERAYQLFVEALAETPNNGWALYGAAEAMRAKGDRAGEKYARNLFKSAWAGPPRGLSIDRL
jgi:tetratricopeptide (TPR) repeat protein